MEEVASTAKLVDTIAPDDGRALTATIPRSQVEAALEEGGSADLILDVARIHDGDWEDRTATISWERADLEKLLRRASGDQIELTFDQTELEGMLDTDVEAHGFREKALVLTVAAATAAGMSGSARAMVDSGGGGSQAAPISGLVTPAEPSTGDGGFSIPDSAVDAALAGGLALLITGAAFVTRAQRRREQPT
jgi:hypothetical protein